MDGKIDHSETALFFRSAYQIPGCQRVALVSLLGFLRPEAPSSDFVKHFQDFWVYLECTQGVDEQRGNRSIQPGKFASTRHHGDGGCEASFCAAD